MKNPLFYAKILLFGEYGIIENSKGLTIPYNFYKGTLKFDENDVNSLSNEALKGFALYIQENFSDKIDAAAFLADVDQGMYFDSDIPQGYGIGSSGALVAAVYDKYAMDKINPGSHISKDSITELKSLLGELESYFHGKSSGIDPLICYMNLPLLINSSNDISSLNAIPASNEGKGAIFLINSGAPGETAPMVQLFFEKLKQDGFRKTLKDEFIKYNNACIEYFVNGNMNGMFTDLKKLSTWAFVHFKPMIPERVLKAWETGIQTNAYYLKLCGSGGGGYVLGFTEDYEKARKHLKDFSTEVIYRF